MSSPGDTARLTVWLHGQVQGVGFRWWTRSRALELGLSGHATNTSDGRVAVVAEGSREELTRLLDLLHSHQTPGEVTAVVDRWDAATGEFEGFEER